MHIHTGLPYISAYQRINDYMGAHVECIFADEHRIAYDFAFVIDSNRCVITLRCGCGNFESIEVSQSLGHEIASMSRSHDTPTRERITHDESVLELVEA